MKYCNLRIAWSVVWGVSCILLVVLWVRSYSWSEFLRIPITDSYGVFGTNFNGQTSVGILRTIPRKWSIDRWSPNRFDPNGVRHLFGQFGTQPSTLFVPSWFLVVFAGSLAAAPWIVWPNRFTLRTLLIATTLVAIVLGMIVAVV
jgi:hypothetical protein